ncbi:ABC transporter ATP-binding protein [Paraburkholderia phenoliruptrix]|nr:ABC transporter ATP-binding protein [Paraburkholderia phenoliruptrix]
MVSNVTKRFDERTVLGELNLNIAAGEFVVLLGRSGSGKSTLLRLLGSLDDDVSGTIRVPRRRAIVFQDARMMPWLTVLSNVTLGHPQTADVRRRALSTLTEVGLEKHAHAWPRTLSGGEAQRAALARAMAREPQLLLLDEPFGALDALTRIRMHTLLRDVYMRHRPAVLLVTHDVDEAIVLADRIVVLTEGSISFNENVNIQKPRHRADRMFLALRRRLLFELGVNEEQ